MTDTYRVEELPPVDQWEIKRGLCPWCLHPLVDVWDHDLCTECGDEFHGAITVED